jgi:hypothetical protein
MKFQKDNTKYIIDSKLAKNEDFNHLNYKYSISPNIKKSIIKKIKEQKKFLNNSPLSYRGEEILTLMDVSWSANHSKNYYAEVQNRVNTLKQICDDNKYIPVFMTITAPSEYKPLKTIRLKKNVIKLVDNPNYQGVTPRETVKYFLSPQWSKFLRLKVIQKMVNNGDKFHYIKTYEPMVDGTPHMHVVGWIKAKYKNEFRQVFKRHFQKSRYQIDFVEDSNKAVNYVMKYITKSFDARDTEDGTLSDEALWFAQHRIIRFTMSRSLAPLWLYRKVRSYEKHRDYKKMSWRYRKGSYTTAYFLDGYYGQLFAKTDQEYIEAKEQNKKIELGRVGYMYISDGEVEEDPMYYKRHYQIELYDKSLERAQKIPTKLDNKRLIIETESKKVYKRGSKVVYTIQKQNKPLYRLKDFSRDELQGMILSDSEFSALRPGEKEAIQNEINMRRRYVA